MDAELHEARVEKLRAEGRKANAEALEAERAAAMAAILLEREQDKRERELVKDERVHVYRFIGEVGNTSVKTCIDELQAWSRLDPGCAITIVFHSPGGDIVSGFALWDFLQELREKGHYITTVARGYAASMAGILLQAGDKRIMGKESWLLIHEAQFGVSGSFGDVEDRVRWVKKVQKRIVKIFAERSKLTAAQIEKKWHRTDWWIDSDEALKLGLIDEIG